MPSATGQLILAAASLMVLAGCQSSGPTAAATARGVSVDEPGSASARVHAELEAEARALGTAQGVAALAASVDKTGAASIPLLIGVNASNAAYQARSEARVKAAEDEDMQATYRRYGMNPDGTPSGRPGPGSAR
ncbi:hypothetical protein [Microvirga sesbaniae]|uniref:hypothetical protein n=1 Tax=Microvirga sesbaniae TaxID=681392 RepID=UPI0021C76096|nr:hypothetical protein [Microvirga sp. HBU67692]